MGPTVHRYNGNSQNLSKKGKIHETKLFQTKPVVCNDVLFCFRVCILNQNQKLVNMLLVFPKTEYEMVENTCALICVCGLHHQPVVIDSYPVTIPISRSCILYDKYLSTP